MVVQRRQRLWRHRRTKRNARCGCCARGACGCLGWLCIYCYVLHLYTLACCSFPTFHCPDHQAQMKRKDRSAVAAGAGAASVSKTARKVRCVVCGGLGRLGLDYVLHLYTLASYSPPVLLMSLQQPKANNPGVARAALDVLHSLACCSQPIFCQPWQAPKAKKESTDGGAAAAAVGADKKARKVWLLCMWAVVAWGSYAFVLCVIPVHTCWLFAAHIRLSTIALHITLFLALHTTSKFVACSANCSHGAARRNVPRISTTRT